MTRILPQIIALLTGVALGGGAMVIVMKKGPEQVIRTQSQAGAAEQVIYATLLHERRYAELDQVLQRNMRGSLDWMKGLGFQEELRFSAPLVKGYYDLAEAPIPAGTAPYLSGVTGADVRKLAHFAAGHAN